MINKIVSYIIDRIERNYQQGRIIKFLTNHNIKIIFDCGAHKGEFITLISNNIKNYEKIYSFEPQINIFNILKTYAKPKKIHCYNNALSNNNSIKKLKINQLTSTSTLSEINENSFWFKWKNILLSGSIKSSFVNEELVNCVTIDDFVKNNNIVNIDLLKIDTEGHDLNVLRGSINLLKQKKIKLILIEFHLSNMYKNYKPIDMHKLLLSFNFKLIKKLRFPFLMHEDRIYLLEEKRNKNNSKE